MIIIIVAYVIVCCDHCCIELRDSRYDYPLHIDHDNCNYPYNSYIKYHHRNSSPYPRDNYVDHYCLPNIAPRVLYDLCDPKYYHNY